MIKRFLLLTGAMLFLAACEWIAQPADPAEDPNMDIVLTDENTVYSAFTPAVLTDGEGKILFFYSDGCADCRIADEQLTRIFDEGAPFLSVYRVDFNANATVRQRYNVSSQPSFVVVDGQGNAVETILEPTEAELRTMLGE